MSTKTTRYNASIVAASLLINDSRKIAELILQKPSKEEWSKALLSENILQKRSPLTIKKQAKVIRNRLELMTIDYCELINKGSQNLIKQALLAATVKQSHLLGDFIQQVVIRNHKSLKKVVTDIDWNRFMLNCANVDPSIENWAESTKKKIRQIIFKILEEAHYINSTKDKKITPVIIEPKLLAYLKQHKEIYVLKSIQFHN
jgi:hypothetical protein